MSQLSRIDLRDEAAAFYIQVPPSLLVANELAERTVVRGEIHFVAAEPLVDLPVPVELRRLGFYGVHQGDDAPNAGFSMSAVVGAGVARPTDSDGTRWLLSLETSALVTYEQLESNEEPPREPDYYMAPTAIFFGNLSIHFRYEEGAPPEQRLHLLNGTIDFTSEPSPGPLRDLHLDLAELPIRTLRPDDIPLLQVPVMPIVFPLHGGDWTGESWTRQLASANRLWEERCCIRFVPRDIQQIDRSDLVNSNSVRKIFKSYKRNDVVEVYFVHGAIGGYTGSGGFASARVILSEPNSNKPNLLAHEFAHVLGGCHPGGTDCFWEGDPGTILSVTTPEHPPINSSNNCHNARSRQPLFTTALPNCRMRPDP